MKIDQNKGILMTNIVVIPKIFFKQFSMVFFNLVIDYKKLHALLNKN